MGDAFPSDRARSRWSEAAHDFAWRRDAPPATGPPDHVLVACCVGTSSAAGRTNGYVQPVPGAASTN